MARLTGNLTISTGSDGYAQHFGVEETTTLAVQVKGDDNQTWKLQCSLDDGSSWWDVEDTDGTLLAAPDARPRSFTVTSYSQARVFVSDTTTTYTMHFKGV